MRSGRDHLAGTHGWLPAQPGGGGAVAAASLVGACVLAPRRDPRPNHGFRPPSPPPLRLPLELGALWAHALIALLNRHPPPAPLSTMRCITCPDGCPSPCSSTLSLWTCSSEAATDGAPFLIYDEYPESLSGAPETSFWTGGYFFPPQLHSPEGKHWILRSLTPIGAAGASSSSQRQDQGVSTGQKIGAGLGAAAALGGAAYGIHKVSGP